jgi:hypothetical protein
MQRFQDDERRNLANQRLNRFTTAFNHSSLDRAVKVISTQWSRGYRRPSSSNAGNTRLKALKLRLGVGGIVEVQTPRQQRQTYADGEQETLRLDQPQILTSQDL